MKTSENDLISRMKFVERRGFGCKSLVKLGIGDDAALLVPAQGRQIILTCDWFLEGTHFLRDTHPPDAIGWKCLARAVSDIAAMGGEPKCFLLSLALPDTQTGQWLDNFVKGLRKAARNFKCALVGGDTTRKRDILINITAVGGVPSGKAVLRSGARPGDRLFVSGRLGEADLGLQLLRRHKHLNASARGRNEKKDENDVGLRKHLYPEPRLALGRWLAENRIATAMMDVSDGLSSDLPRLCRASRVGARIAAAKIPYVQIAKRRDAGSAARIATSLARALNGGDDYELLFTVRRGQADRLPRLFKGVLLTEIGEITRAKNITIIGFDGRVQALRPQGWDPFRK